MPTPAPGQAQAQTQGPDPDRTTRVDFRLRRAAESGSLPKDVLICGPAGTGKTWGILAFIHLLAADYPDLRILFCRQTRVSLSDSVLVTYEQEILPADGMEEIAQRVNRRHRTSYVYPSGSEIVLGGMDNPTRIASTAWDIAFVNEAIELEEDGWETISSRLNRPGRDPRFGWLIGDTNPGDPAHWLKKRCEEGRTVLWDTVHQANPTLHDGMDWTPAGWRYRDWLGRLKGTRRRRYFEGLWAAGEGQWFSTFSDAHISKTAEFDPRWPVTLAVDSGVHSGAVWFQVREMSDGPIVTVFGDFYAHDVHAFAVAHQILARGVELCGGRWDRGVTDPAGSARNPIGPSVLAEYERAGLRGLYHWPKFPGSVVDGLALVESFVSVDPPALLVHPRCVHLLNAFANYKRAKRGGQYVDIPEPEAHPYEDLMDALRGGLQDRFPSGRRPQPQLYQRSAASMMY
jgi:hypothetical protein